MSHAVRLVPPVHAAIRRICSEDRTMDLPLTRSKTGLVLLALGVVATLVGMLLWSGVSSATALVFAVVLLTSGTLLYGTASEPPGRSTQ